MIFPYRDLPAGHWQLSCTNQGLEAPTDSTTDNTTDSPVENATGIWEKAIAFQVSDRLSEVEKMPTLALEIEEENTFSLRVSPDLGVENLDDDRDESLSLAPSLDESITPTFPLVLTLDRNEFSEIGEAFLLLAGQVEATERDRPFNMPARLRYRLQDLDSAVYILDEPKSWLPNLGEVTPFTFQETLALPPTQATDLLGEVLIETETGEILAQVLFNLTLSARRQEAVEGESVNYTIELSNLENQSSFTFEVIVPKEAAETPLNVDLPNPARMNRLLKRSQWRDRSVLPPKIEPIRIKSSPKKSLQLPKISPS